MSRVFGSLSWLALVALPSCLVSFNDYPLGDVEGAIQGGKSSIGQSGASGGPDASGDGGTDDGAGGADVGAGAVPSSGPQVIDDFEDGDAELPTGDGRSGRWYVGNDGSAMQTPPANATLMPTRLMPPREMSERGVRTFGGPFQTWGALVGTALSTSQGLRVPYDVSAFGGIRLWVRSGAAPSPVAATSVRVNFPTLATTPGGGCSACNDHFGIVIQLTPKWERVEIDFGELAQAGFGLPRESAPDLRTVLGLELLFPRGVVFDLWLDDIELIER